MIASDEEKLWKGKPVIARTREAILGAMKSKYAISPTNSVYSELIKVPGRYALVGLPCQIHGYVKAAELDERLKERVVLTIGLYCHAAIEHEAFEVIWEALGDKTDDFVNCYLEKVEGNYDSFTEADSDLSGCEDLAKECATDMM